jgi:pimeloyl-ACP methyl ester carboxylesterase
MPYEHVTRPVPAPEAFRQTGSEAVQSQAALLLLLGRQLRGDDQAIRARAIAAGRESQVEVIPADDEAGFPVPTLRVTGERVRVADVERRLIERYGRFMKRRAPVKSGTPQLPKALGDAAERLYANPDSANAAELMEACLRHPDELTRVAAAASYFAISTSPQRLLRILVRGTRSGEPLVREVAATALARVAPEHPRLRQMTKRGPSHSGGESSHTAMFVHGTFARNHEWWQPGGSFHTYLKNSVRPDVYSEDDRFDWSGGYSDAARDIGADELRAWINQHNLAGLDLFGHSHGANVTMEATRFGLQAGKLILLSCPVHVHKYIPDFTQTLGVVSIRVHLDLVILADQGGQRFNHPQIRENVLSIWFDHGASHNPQVWQQHNVPALL